MNKTFENAMRLRDYIIKIRNEKIPLPSVIPNCGSFYKNIIVDKNTLDKVLIKYPEMIYFNFNYNGENKYKLGTGYIIDKILGMKGYRDGDVGTNTMNSLQIVNYNKEENKLMGREILLLANYIRDKIKEKIDNKLEIEIEVNMVE
ncbi:MAG: hypothetical protein QM532_02310 [Cyanobium sp. MAG06]|nr:hypothetical protein [Cyanobium sp. MAG06]